MLRIFYNKISSLRNFLVILTGCSDVLLRIICKSPRDRGTRINPMCIVERNALAICERPVLSFRKLRGQTQESRIECWGARPGESSPQRWIHSPSSYVACKRITKWIDLVVPLKPVSDYALEIEDCEINRNGLKIKIIWLLKFSIHNLQSPMLLIW